MELLSNISESLIIDIFFANPIEKLVKNKNNARAMEIYVSEAYPPINSLIRKKIEIKVVSTNFMFLPLIE